ncbi:MAG: M24 family metallopeptidase [archaeon]|nr:M24 family metallopeptidase [archaeon]
MTDFTMHQRKVVSGIINLEILGKKDIEKQKKIEGLKICSKIALASIHIVKRKVKIGMTEQDILKIISNFIKKYNLSMTPLISGGALVASGPNTAKIHGMASKRQIKTNEPIMIDMGLKRKGRIFSDYCSDLTRTFYFGEAPDDWIEIWKIVQKAQHKAIKLIKPGISAHLIDFAARKVIRDELNGYDIPHGVGHAVKRMQHATPQMRLESADILKEGDVITVEPGWYGGEYNGEQKTFGIRIEDLFLVTSSGYEALSSPDNIEDWI